LTVVGSANARAWNEQVLYSFTGGVDGQQPWAGVTLDGAGNIYGAVTFAGASQNCGPSGCGNIYKIASDGTFSVLHNFSWDDGANPASDLVLDKATGDLYGSTLSGGSGGAGTVFKLASNGTLTTLYAFTGGADGNTPEGRLLRTRRGDIYGTTYGGGDHNMGLLYELTAGGKLKRWHSFGEGAGDGTFPTGAGLAASGHVIYGMTQFGGSSDYGTVFQLDLTSNAYWTMHSFAGGKDGRYPAAGLIADKDGTVYGTTQDGGGSYDICTYGCGTVFAMTPAGSETILHRFKGGADGSNSLATLVRTGKGALFGTTNDGSKGTVFELKPDGHEHVLHTFGEAGDGFEPVTGVTRDKSGNLYGTTDLGGASGLGTVYVLRK
ncbi:MAG TPA: choice-of-anchor tandem repeat GloVer-containing protein, partial [Rhizomicrobium sp.]|nr:choice-of-anchor tandem repeat GloVer-containing protein [Rhizomicrobium sp.]